MKLTGLSLEQAPPISVPFRFFLSAAIFGALSALMLIYFGPEVLSSRWTNGTLAITHGLVLGLVASVMFGALQQMLPVLAGAVIPHPKIFVWILHLSWIIGVILLIAAFTFQGRILFSSAIFFLASCVILFCSACVYALYQASSKSDSVLGFKLAITALFITVLMGTILALGHNGILPLLRPMGTNIHALWGLIGWVSLLIISVAGQVVPMFQITKQYPARLTKRLPLVLFVLIMIKSIVVVYQYYFLIESATLNELIKAFDFFIDATISLFLITFAFFTLHLQRHRLRKIKDTHIYYWQIACFSLIGSIGSWWLAEVIDNIVLAQQIRLFSTVFFLMGFVIAIITAMLYKIVAFLVWFHLNGKNTQLMMSGQEGFSVPHMKEVISSRAANLQFVAYLVALCLILPAIFWPSALTQIAGIFWFTHFTIMLINLSKAVFIFRSYN